MSQNDQTIDLGENKLVVIEEAGSIALAEKQPLAGEEPENNNLNTAAETRDSKSSKSKDHDAALHEIDLSEIDAYLKTLVPGVLGMSENLVKLGGKFQHLTDEMGERVKVVDVNISRYERLLVKKNKLMQIGLLASIAVVFITVIIMFVAAFNYTSQVNQMNALSLSLARRLSEVNSGLVTFEQLNESIQALNTSTEQLILLSENQTQLLSDGLQAIELQGIAITSSLDSSLGVWKSSVSGELSAMLEDTRSSAAGIVRAIEQVVASQRGLQESAPTLRELVGLREQISALIVLERNQYLETIAAAKETQNRSEIEVDSPGLSVQYRRAGQESSE